jgi:crotonobetainyl-CoA:carnitine CoA-transferase CaiB-like acyl-CoA transferase
MAGLRVLELGSGVAGPTTGRLLAAYGADVVKVEPPEGDVTRQWGPFPSDQPDPEASGAFLVLNTGKRSIVLDGAGDGRQVIARMAAAADVVIESFGPGGLDDVGLSWAALHEANPATVLVSISPFGLDGPAAGNASSPFTSFAAGGQMWLTGEASEPPRKNYGNQADYQAGYHAFSASLAAVVGARRHGQGDHIDISIQEVQASTLEMYGPNAFNHGIESYRLGNVLRATWGIYPCADGYIGMHALPRNVPSLMRAIGEDDLAAKYDKDPNSVLDDDDEVAAIIYGWCAERTKKEIFQIGLERRAPIAYVPTIAELLEWPGLKEKNFFVEVDHPVAGPLPYASAPFTMSVSGSVLTRAPLLGEHTDEVLAGWLGEEG